MTRFTLHRSVIRAETDRHAAPQPKPIPTLPPSHLRRWSARVFVVPTVLVEAFAKLAARAHRSPIEEQKSVHRQRGVYIWRSAEAANADAEDLLPMPDVSTAEIEIAKINGKVH